MTLRIIFFLILPCFLYGQNISDSIKTVYLPEVNIESGYIDIVNTGRNSIAIDSLLINTGSSGNLGNILSSYTPLFIKNYGLTGLSTISVRGTNASSNLFLWNNISLQNGMNGQLDL